MRRKLIPEKDIIDLSKKVVQGFYHREVDGLIQYLADDFMWVGAFDFQYATNKEQFLNITQSELNSLPFNIMDEEFFLLSKNSSMYVVCAKLKLFVQTDENTIVRTHTRLTIIWKYYDNELKLSHVHGSNAQDIPLSVSVKNTDYSHDKGFFTYINSLNNSGLNDKISFRDVDGKYRYYLPEEIIYLEANMQNTRVYTSNECVVISGLLLEQGKKLPKQFYRIHKSYIINTDFLKSLKRYQVELSNDIILPLSKEKFMDFRVFINEIIEK